MKKNPPDIELSSVKINKDNVTITLSKNMARYLGINRNKKEIFIIPTNGLCQLSVGEVISTIPVLTEYNMQFEQQHNLG